MKIHVISTITGQENEGMRNVATHIARAWEANNEVLYSGLKDIAKILCNTGKSDATVIFARANRLVYLLALTASLLSRNVWIACVQKPDERFQKLCEQLSLPVSYFTLVQEDLAGIKLRKNSKVVPFQAGINAKKFAPVAPERAKELKQKYGFSADKKLILHVGHCSIGRGLEDFAALGDPHIEKLVVASGMFTNQDIVDLLQKANVRLVSSYMEHIEEVYQMADAYLFPTRSTEYVISIPLSVMEALSCGTPVVAYRSFSNLCYIAANDESVHLIDSIEALEFAIQCACTKKEEKSLLRDAISWEESAAEMLAVIEDNMR